MLTISNVNVYGLDESMIASGYPMRTEFPVDVEKEKLSSADPRFLRSQKLGNTPSNSGHGNFLTGVIVQFDVTYPAYWSMQFQRYHFAQIVSSSSKMHKLSKMNLEECMNKYVQEDVIRNLQILQDEYNSNPTYENYMRLLSNCPMGIELTMRVSTNYMQLLTIWNQRHTHKLKEDWGTFCKWIETLPYFIELTGIKK
jgi:hypothetical protein